MKVAVVALTRKGSELGAQLFRRLAEEGGGENGGADLFVPGRFYREILAGAGEEKAGRGEFGDEGGFRPDEDCSVPAEKKNPAASGIFFFDCPLRNLVASLFPAYGGLVMIMAAGIVVRLVAPLLRGKDKDPAVVVMDEDGEFAVSLLSGHLGGANELAKRAAAATGGRAVITTATDVRKTFAVDALAKKWGMACDPPGAVKKINAALANGERVVFFANRTFPEAAGAAEKNVLFRPLGEIFRFFPAASGPQKKGEEPVAAAVLITNGIYPPSLFGGIPFVFLRPKNLVVGVGCKRGTPAEEIVDAIFSVLGRAGLVPSALKALASISGKRNEPGLLAAARQLGLRTVFFSPAEIEEGAARFAQSEKVRKRVGVGAVCEPAAWLAAGKPPRLLVPKTVCGRVTVAVAGENYG